MTRNILYRFLYMLLFITVSLLAAADTYHPASVSYYVHPVKGNDANAGTSKTTAFQTLARIEQLQLQPGDRIILANGQTYTGSLRLIKQRGTEAQPIRVSSEKWNSADPDQQALINFKSRANGILIKDCSSVHVSGVQLTANGYGESQEISDMRCAVLITIAEETTMQDINVSRLAIKDVYYENPGFMITENEVKTANGTLKYGWGIRVINTSPERMIRKVLIDNCTVQDVAHTGIKLTGARKNIAAVRILNNSVLHTGGPGIQMSEVKDVYVAGNTVDHSGSTTDSRKWGRGSGLWTWGASNVLIEKNRFLHANGPGDSDGAHIDYNCDNITVQYNFSAYNAGGFCEILGNNYNCIYRYNVSVNDGARVKGKNGAFQEGKTLWLSGYQGNNQKRKGPVNSFIYNNTIYADSTIHPKIAFDNTSRDVVIANNIFCLAYPFRLVDGDQMKADVNTVNTIENMRLLHNLFLQPSDWPKELQVTEQRSLFGNPGFVRAGGQEPRDYVPVNTALVKGKGIDMKLWNGKGVSLNMEKDMLGNPVAAQPAIGAIEISAAGH
jgi:hypothetical protein